MAAQRGESYKDEVGVNLVRGFQTLYVKSEKTSYREVTACGHLELTPLSHHLFVPFCIRSLLLFVCLLLLAASKTVLFTHICFHLIKSLSIDIPFTY